MDGITYTIALQDILIERSTLVDLENKTIANLPTTKRQFATGPVQLVGLKITPSTEDRQLRFDGIARSEGKTYKPTIVFRDVVFEDAPTNTNITFKATTGSEYSIEQIDEKKQTVEVKCNCLDFFYRFALWNYNDDSLYGPKPPPYVKKTDRPPVNPAKSPGLCKHLIKMSQMLEDSKFTG